MIKGYHSQIMKRYENIRDDQTESLRKRRAHIEKELPKIIDIENEIGKLCVKLSISALRSIENRDAYLDQLKEKIMDLRVTKSELLVGNGYDINYLNLQYNCDKCKDTGFIGSTKCSCYKQMLVAIYYKNSDLKDMLTKNNFDNFKLDFYPARKNDNEAETPRKNMEKILSKSLSFIKNFSDSDENLLFYGSSGTGKTFLSHCIAKELFDKGFFVVYRTSEELIKDLKDIRFNNNYSLEELLINCDLLIIDDLGTEQLSDFSKTELFNLLNSKLLKRQKMLISTNLSLETLLKTYSERITSRLMGNFTLCKFYGDDIRIKMNLSKLR